MNKWIFILLLTFYTLPLVAQGNHPPALRKTRKHHAPKVAVAVPAGTKETTLSLNKKVEAAILRAPTKPLRVAEDLEPDLLTRAEELLQQDRDAHNGEAVHNLSYYYHQLKAQQSTSAKNVSHPLYDPYFTTRAEDLLQQDMNAHEGIAIHSFDYYYQQLLNGNLK